MTSHSCVGCGKEIPDGTKFSICEDCLDQIEILDEPTCEICGDKLKNKNDDCMRCKNEDYHFDRNFSYCYYTFIPAKIVKDYKYNLKKYFAKPIAEMMLEKDKAFDGVDIITYVPLGKKRRKERGFNQSEEIARILGKVKNIPVLELITKEGSEIHQAGLTNTERKKNLKNSFFVSGIDKNLVKGKTVLLIDDIFTTGTTLSESAKVIRELKPRHIYTYTFAKTKPWAD